ncbi:mitogen activated protein kinase 2 [Diatrype stigma]|uniref:Mitogen activated protein kinase 2 n=1 Tax=Diatrype stigma TaxID=117547 RepID=A0AAN9UVT0_9PEZI
MTSLYDIIIPQLLTILTVTKNLLNKGAEHAKEKNIPISELLNARLYDDMRPFTFQVWMICSTIRKAIERLTGTAPAGTLGGVDQEYTVEDLLAMVDDATKLLQDIKPETLEGKEDVRVPCALGPANFEARLVDYAQGYPIPTAYFHVSMVYGLLRNKGVPVGKSDYIRPFLKDFELKDLSS